MRRGFSSSCSGSVVVPASIEVFRFKHNVPAIKAVAAPVGNDIAGNERVIIGAERDPGTFPQTVDAQNAIRDLHVRGACRCAV